MQLRGNVGVVPNNLVLRVSMEKFSSIGYLSEVLHMS